VLFPLFPTDLSHAGYSLVACLDMPVASFTFFDLGWFTRWNDRFDGRLLSCGRIGQQSMDMPSLIRAIGIASLDRRIDLPQERFELTGIRRIGLRQLLGDDLLCVRVDAQMKFALGPPFTRTVLASRPLAFAIDFQPRRIHHQMHRTLCRSHRQRYTQLILSARQRRVIGHCQHVLQAHQLPQGFNKTLRLAQRHFNRLIRVGILRTALRRPLIISTRYDRFIHPQRQAAPSNQGAIIRRPILHAVDRFFLDRFRNFRYVAHRRLLGKRGRCFLPETTAQSNWKACLVSTY